MKQVARVLLALIWLLSFRQVYAAPQPFPETVPSTFRITYDHDMGVKASVEFKDGRLLYQRWGTEGNQTMARRPTLEQWAQFFREINSAKVYKWSDHYAKTVAMPRDGDSHWSVDLQTSDVILHSDGTSAFPLDGDLTEAQRGNSRNKSFDLMLEAVSHLLGQNFP
jgi:hypothetical protein